MKCPICYYHDTKVIDSRVAADGLSIRRRRECLKCGFRYSTYEQMEILDLSIMKRDGRREVYDREKLVRGLRRSLEKRPVTEEKFKKLVSLIERDLQRTKKSEITSVEIGRIVMKHLRRLDQVAYIRFASVYQSFKDIETFRQELDKLFKSGAKNRRGKIE